MRTTTKQTASPQKKRPPATSPEARENQMISIAHDLAEKQILDGTASSQVLTHFLKQGSTTARLEKEVLILQKDLMKAKTEAIQSGKRTEELYKNALAAMQKYTGSGPGEAND